MPTKPILVCNQCDLVQQETELQPGEKARCAGCDNVLYRSQPNGLRLSLIFAITSIALFLISNAFPIVTISSQGLTNSTTLLEAVGRLVEDGITSIAALVLITTFLMPAMEILILVYLLLPLRLGRIPPGLSLGFRLICLVKPWAMIEVFMIGLIVTITKLNGLASVSPGIGLIAFVLLMISITVATSNFDSHAFWQQIDSLRKNELKPALSTASHSLVSCEACGLAQPKSTLTEVTTCRRCGSHVHERKPNSITRTWALVIAGYVLIIPANLMPVMATGSLFGTENDTIFSGVLYLWESNSEVLAIILFCASIVIPFAKLFSLTFLLISVQRHSTWNPVFRAKLYRAVEFVGRWSMIDVYVATMLTALVQFGSLMSIRASAGAIAFASVVVITIFAAKSFDPRLIWDNAKVRPVHHNKLTKEAHV